MKIVVQSYAVFIQLRLDGSIDDHHHILLKDAGEVKLELFDMLGRKVAVLVGARQEAGSYTYSFNAARYGLSRQACIFIACSRADLWQRRRCCW